MTIEQRQMAIIEKAKAQQEARLIARLETPAGERDFLVEQDKALLNTIKTRVETAYGKQLPSGFKFNDVIETLVTIASRLQYANKEVRELLQPGTNEIDLYALFDRETRDEIIKAYGALPYSRQATVLTMLDGTTEVLDADLVEQARVGRKADVNALNNCIARLATRLGLYADYQATEEQEATAFNDATARMARLEKLATYQAQLEA